MKIIIPNIPIPVFFDTIQCLESIKNIANIQAAFWNPQHKSIMDLFDEQHPDILFLHESQLDSAFELICQEFNFKYVLYTENPIPPTLKKKPDLVMSHITLQQNIKEPNAILLKPLVKVSQIHSSHYDKSLSSDILIDTSSITINEGVLQTITFLYNTYNCKIIGNTPIESHYYLGKTTMYERANFIRSSKIFIALNQEDFWDASYLYSAPIVLDIVNPNIKRAILPPETLTFDSIALLKQQVDSLINKNLLREKYVNYCNNLAKKNTSFHLSASIFNRLNEKDISNVFIQYLQELIK